MVAITIGGIAILPRSQGENNGTLTSKIETASLTKYGLEIVDPKHPEFSKLMAEKPSGPITAFSVFVANNNDKAIASCSLKWEMVLPNSQITTQFQTKTGNLGTISDGKLAHLMEGIASKGNLLFSLTESSSPDNQAGIGSGFRTKGESSNITDQLLNIVKVRVSIDGVLFTDGTYVGPDTNNYFELFRGQIEANRDLDSEIEHLVNNGARTEAIMNHLKKLSNTQSSEVQIPAGEDSQYSLGKWMQKRSYAKLLLVMREKKGDQAVLDHVRAELSNPQIKLQKLKED